MTKKAKLEPPILKGDSKKVDAEQYFQLVCDEFGFDPATMRSFSIAWHMNADGILTINTWRSLPPKE